MVLGVGGSENVKDTIVVLQLCQGLRKTEDSHGTFHYYSL